MESFKIKELSLGFSKKEILLLSSWEGKELWLIFSYASNWFFSLFIVSKNPFFSFFNSSIVTSFTLEFIFFIIASTLLIPLDLSSGKV